MTAVPASCVSTGFGRLPSPYPVQQQVEVIQACGGLKTYLAGNRVNAETAFEQIYGSDWREFPGEAYLRDDWEEMYGRWELPRAR